MKPIILEKVANQWLSTYVNDKACRKRATLSFKSDKGQILKSLP